MKVVRFIFSAALLLGSLYGVAGVSLQPDSDTLTNATSDTSRVETPKAKMNIIKLNLLSPFFKNINVRYERVIIKYLSLSLSASFMPNATLPYAGLIYNISGSTDQALEDALKGMKMTSFSVSPEVRFYPGKKGFGKGFYIALSYRYSHYQINDLNYIYANYPQPDSAVSFTGNLNAHYGGLLLGAQWFLGKHFTLDWWFFGPLVGFESSRIVGVSSVILSEEDQNDLRDALEGMDMPNTKKTIYVDQYGATVDLRGLMYGMNFGIALGFRF